MTPPGTKPVSEPPRSRFERSLAGAGIIEAAGRNLVLAPPVSGQVAKVHVRENDRVRAGDPVYSIDDREQRARLETAGADIARAESSILAARAEISFQRAAERSAESNIAAFEAELADLDHALERDRILRDKGVVPERQAFRSEKNRDAARARLEQAEAQLTQARAQSDIIETRVREAESNLAYLKARKQEIEVAIEKLTVRAPMTGRVLQINIRAGEFVSTTQPLPPVLFGETDRLQVRVDVDEFNASRVEPGSAATASLKGDSGKTFPLEFVRIDPYIQPKRSLTGDNTERVDVRVLQVIYSFARPAFPVYVGQQVDVFIDDDGAFVSSREAPTVSGSR